MKQARSTKAVNTIPNGAYECGITSEKMLYGSHNEAADPGLDSQKNGYPGKNAEGKHRPSKTS